MTPEQLNAFKLWNKSEGLDRGQVDTLIDALEEAQAKEDRLRKAIERRITYCQNLATLETLQPEKIIWENRMSEASKILSLLEAK